ncbi:MAG: hypothetical protein JSS32_06705 [Verrucomicrobia bacterium]|nr:hypothetical protein [Verrucomicrobiota bacterium]
MINDLATHAAQIESAASIRTTQTEKAPPSSDSDYPASQSALEAFRSLARFMVRPVREAVRVAKQAFDLAIIHKFRL